MHLRRGSHQEHRPHQSNQQGSLLLGEIRRPPRLFIGKRRQLQNWTKGHSQVQNQVHLTRFPTRFRQTYFHEQKRKQCAGSSLGVWSEVEHYRESFWKTLDSSKLALWSVRISNLGNKQVPNWRFWRVYNYDYALQAEEQRREKGQNQDWQKPIGRKGSLSADQGGRGAFPSLFLQGRSSKDKERTNHSSIA